MRFVRDHEAEVSAARPEVPQGLNDRAGDIWEPLLALADLASGEWPRLAREAAQGLNGGAIESNVIGLLLIHIFAVFADRGAERIFSRDLVAALNGYANRPWAEGVKGEMIDEYWLANRLRRYGVRPKTMWIQGVVAKGYMREDFEEVFGRYITKVDVEEVRGKSESTNDEAPNTKEAPITDEQAGTAEKHEAERSPVQG